MMLMASGAERVNGTLKVLNKRTDPAAVTVNKTQK